MIRLYINYTEIEIQQDTNNVLANFSINDIGGVGQRRGAVTQTIELPATAANQSALLTLSATGAPAYIESNGVSVFSGRARVSEIKRNISGIVSILVTLYGDNLDFAYLLSDKQVRDVVTETFTLDLATVENGVSGKVLFPLVNYGELDTPNQIDILEMRPAINIFYVLEKILNGIGYKLSSNFAGTVHAQKLHFIFTCGAYFPDATYLRNLSFRAERTSLDTSVYSLGGYARLRFNDDSTPPNYDPSGAYDTGVYEWRTPKNGIYSFTAVIKSTDATRPESIDLIDTLGNPINSIPLVSDDGTFLTYRNNAAVLPEYDGVGVFPIEFWAYKSGAAGLTYNFEATTYIEVVRNPTLYELDDINISDCLPLDTTQLDFIKGLTHLFNLYFYADVNRKIFYCEPRNNYVGSSGLESGFYDTTIIDINDLVNVGNETTVKIYDNLGEVVRFQHNEGDNYVGQIENGTNEILYSATWGMETQAKQNVTVSENPVFGRFSLMSSDTYATTGQVVLPRLWNADWGGSGAYPAKSYEFAPMIAIIEEAVPLANGWTLTYGGGGTATYADYNYAFMFDFPALSSQVLSLSFGNEVNVLGSTTAGLLQRFYLREQVSKRGGQVMELKMVVSAWLINYLHSIRYKAFFQYGGELYAIQEIKNYVVGSTEICSVSLLLERFADAADVALIENSGLNCFNNV